MPGAATMMWLVIFGLFGLARPDNLVPVLIWCDDCSAGSVNPLHRTSHDEFKDLISQHLARTQPPTVVFLRDHFCVEDVKKHQEYLQKLKSSKSSTSLTYLTAVESAELALRTFPHNDTTDENLMVDINDGQLTIVPTTDIDPIPAMYSMLKESNPNLVAILTGKTCPYTAPTERYKRAAAEDINDNNSNNTFKILFHIGENPYVQLPSNGKEGKYVKLGNEISREIEVDSNNDNYNITISYSAAEGTPKSSLKLYFQKHRGYFKLVCLEYVPDDGTTKAVTLKTKTNVEFPTKFGYHCGQNITFSSESADKKETLIKLFNMQVQMDATSNAFSKDVYDCVGFMSVPIWTGIFVTIILAVITIWGLIMIMDIRTMDRFDDPKGKTITVSASE